MAAEEKQNSFKGLRSMFLAGSVSKMRDIEDLYPTNIAKSLGLNHSRYIEKLYKPEEFNFRHIWELSKLLDLDVQLIIKKKKKELTNKSKASKKKS